MRVRWLPCGFRFVTREDDFRLNNWRTCTLRRGHWFFTNSPHQGPLDEG